MKGINTLMATVILIGIAISLTVVIGLWLAGFIGVQSIKSHYVKIDVYSLEAYGVIAKVLVASKGSSVISIDGVYINNVPVHVRAAYDLNDRSNVKIYVDKDISSDPFYLKPGHTGELWIIPNEPLQPGVLYDVKIHTGEGYAYTKTIEAEISASLSAYKVLLMAFTDSPTLDARVYASGDVKLYINPKDSNDYILLNGLTLPDPVEKDINKRLKHGENFIAIEYDTTGDPFLGLYLGINYKLENGDRWVDPLIPPLEWQAAVNVTDPNWYDPSYDDSNWEKVVVPIGDSNWYYTRYDLPDGSTMYFRRFFKIPSTIDGKQVTRILYAELRIASDDNATAYVNGVQIGSDTGAHGSSYWNYAYTIDLNKIRLKPGEQALVAVAVTDKGVSFYFDACLFLEVELSDETTTNITIPQYPEIRFKIIPPGENPPANWWSPDFDDTSWDMGYLPIGVNQDVSGVLLRVNTYKNYQRILVRIKFNIEDNIPVAVDNVGYYDEKWSGYHGKIVIFDVVNWKYDYYQVYNPTGDPRKVGQMVFYGQNNVQLSLNDVLSGKDPIYTGDPKVVTKEQTLYAKDFEETPTSPLIIFVNLNVTKQVNLTWVNLNTAYIDRFVMTPVPQAVLGMDIIVLWEDLWSNPEWTHGTFKDERAWLDHVVRVTWLENGEVRIGVYRCSGAYLHVFALSGRFIYYKPHGDTWGDDASTPYTYDENGILVHYEIGYNPLTGSEEEWTSPTGYIVKIWYISP